MKIFKKLGKFGLLTVALVSVLALAACGDTNDDQQTAAEHESIFGQVLAIDGDSLQVKVATMSEEAKNENTNAQNENADTSGAVTTAEDWIFDGSERTCTLNEDTIVMDMNGGSLTVDDIVVDAMLQLDLEGDVVSNIIILSGGQN